MKKSVKTILLSFVILIGLIPNIYSQVPPPPPPNHGSTGNQTGGNAPIGGGLFILLGLSVSYSIKKLYSLKKNELED